MLADSFFGDNNDRGSSGEDAGAGFDSMKSRRVELCRAHGESEGEMLGGGFWELLRLLVNVEVGEVE